MRILGLVAVVVLGMAAGACNRGRSPETVVIEIPPGFNGDFVLRMGVKDAPELPREGNGYLVTVPRSGTLSTSTLLRNPQITFRNQSDGSVWGYSHSVFSTGDGIPVGGKIEFFVGTKKDFDAKENNKKQSGHFPDSENLAAVL